MGWLAVVQGIFTVPLRTRLQPLYSPDGEEIAHYNTSNGGWMNLPTTAENQFLRDSTDVYMQAWDAARAEIKNGAQKQPVACEGETATFDVRA